MRKYPERAAPSPGNKGRYIRAEFPDTRSEASCQTSEVRRRWVLAAARRLRLARGRQSLAIARHQGNQPSIVHTATFAPVRAGNFSCPNVEFRQLGPGQCYPNHAAVDSHQERYDER